MGCSCITQSKEELVSNQINHNQLSGIYKSPNKYKSKKNNSPEKVYSNHFLGYGGSYVFEIEKNNFSPLKSVKKGNFNKKSKNEINKKEFKLKIDNEEKQFNGLEKEKIHDDLMNFQSLNIENNKNDLVENVNSNESFDKIEFYGKLHDLINIYHKLIYILYNIATNNNDSFVEEVYKEINFFRNNPMKYINKIKILKKYLQPVSNSEVWDKNIYSKSWIKKIKHKIDIENICHIGLTNDYHYFDDICNILNPMQKLSYLEFSHDLCISLPDILSKIGIRETISLSIEEILRKNIYKDISFHYDIGINSPIISTILQIVDDSQFKGVRFSNLIKSNKTHIGITSSLVEGYRCVYIVIAEKIIDESYEKSHHENEVEVDVEYFKNE